MSEARPLGAGDLARASVDPGNTPLYTPHMNERSVDQDLDRQIGATHRRLVKAMDGRLPAMSLETKERYFAVLSMLVGKLEEPEKSLREIAQEMIAEAASVIFLEP